VGGLITGLSTFDISLDESYSDQFMVLTSKLLPELIDEERDFGKTMKDFEGLARAIREDRTRAKKQYDEFWNDFSKSLQGKKSSE
jgi:hypothetical protein